MAAVSDTRDMILADAHVHIYPCFDLARMLDAAYSNFSKEAGRRHCEKSFSGVLLLSEKSGDNYFHTLAGRADDGCQMADCYAGDWQFTRTHEACSLNASSDDGRRLVVIAGRQIVTQENLEVLALVTADSFDDGLPVSELLARVVDSGAIPVLPWGVGKWLGRRGYVVASLIARSVKNDIFLGDNSGRPGFLPAPRQFKLARNHGIDVLPGTDPLPIASEGMRCGNFGFAMQGLLSRDHPGEDLVKLLASHSAGIDPYGALEYPLRFMRNQLQIRLRQDKR